MGRETEKMAKIKHSQFSYKMEYIRLNPSLEVRDLLRLCYTALKQITELHEANVEKANANNHILTGKLQI